MSEPRKVEWEPVSLAVALGSEWRWLQAKPGGPVALLHRSGTWAEASESFAYDCDEVTAELAAGALLLAVEAGLTGRVRVEMDQENGEVRCWAVRASDGLAGPPLSVSLPEPVEPLADEAAVETASDAVLLRTHVDVVEVGGSLCDAVRAALEARGYVYDEDTWQAPGVGDG